MYMCKPYADVQLCACARAVNHSRVPIIRESVLTINGCTVPAAS